MAQQFQSLIGWFLKIPEYAEVGFTPLKLGLWCYNLRQKQPACGKNIQVNYVLFAFLPVISGSMSQILDVKNQKALLFVTI